MEYAATTHDDGRGRGAACGLPGNPWLAAAGSGMVDEMNNGSNMEGCSYVLIFHQESLPRQQPIVFLWLPGFLDAGEQVAKQLLFMCFPAALNCPVSL